MTEQNDPERAPTVPLRCLVGGHCGEIQDYPADVAKTVLETGRAEPPGGLESLDAIGQQVAPDDPEWPLKVAYEFRGAWFDKALRNIANGGYTAGNAAEVEDLARTRAELRLRLGIDDQPSDADRLDEVLHAGWLKLKDARRHREECRKAHNRGECSKVIDKWLFQESRNPEGEQREREELQRIEARLGLPKVEPHASAGQDVWRRPPEPIRDLQQLHRDMTECRVKKGTAAWLAVEEVFGWGFPRDNRGRAGVLGPNFKRLAMTLGKSRRCVTDGYRRASGALAGLWKHREKSCK